MDRLESMSILVAVVEAGSLSAAARRLGTPLATVSRKVSELEGHLKTRLLNRTSRRLTLTDAGQSYVAACRRILEQVDEAERAASGEFSAPRGELIVTAPIVFGRLHVLPVATEFLAAYPEIKVRLALADRVVNLMEDHVDVALRIGALPDSSLMATRIGVIRRVVCASPAYFAARGVPKTLADLAAHDCIGFDVLTTAEAWTFEQGRSEISVPISARLTVTTAEAVVDAAISGVGIARVLSYQAAQALRDRRLALALVDFEPAPWPVHLVYTGGRMLPLKLRAFLDFAAPRLKDRLAESGA
jgi:DNA-binding transcriptional LysR family regulator